MLTLETEHCRNYVAMPRQVKKGSAAETISSGDATRFGENGAARAKPWGSTFLLMVEAPQAGKTGIEVEHGWMTPEHSGGTDAPLNAAM